MATTEQHKVPETIRSRCQLFEFRTIATAKILERLKHIANSEKISIPEEALREIARAGEGSMRDAQSAFDQVISFAGETIKKEDVEMALGVAGADILIRIIEGIAESHPVEALKVVDDLVMRGHDLRNFCRDLLSHFRDLLVVKVSGNDELLESAVCERAELEREAARFSEADLVRFFHSLSETETKLRTATHPRYQLEVGLVKLMEMRRLQPINDLVERIAALETALRTGTPPAQSNTPSNTPPGTGGSPPRSSSGSSKAASSSSARSAASVSDDGGKQAAAIVETIKTPVQSAPVVENGNYSSSPADENPVAESSDIERLKNALEKRRKKFLVIALEGARVARIEGDELYVEFAPEDKHLRDTLAKSEDVKVIREACLEVIGRELGVRIAVKDTTANESMPLSQEEEEQREKESLRATAEQHPLVQDVLRKFRGEIIDVQRL
jgi:DNA polymerase-3 subunit gamma/tau